MSRRTSRRERGFSLAELMTALAVFAIIFVAALLIYDRSNKMFSQSSQSAEMQQVTRVSYEKLVQDIRLAGFDYKRAGVPTSSFSSRRVSQPYVVGQIVIPNVVNGHVYKCTTAGTTSSGSPTWNTGTGSTTTDGTVIWTEAGVLSASFEQPDEQIEYAWHSAITLRANYNYDAPPDSNHYDHGRETALESAQFPVVTTGNEEIVTYVLKSDKPGAANGDSVTFYADVNNGGSPSRTAYPAGNAERLITINGVDLSNANPPYTLYRVTLDSAGAVVRTPLSDNIRSMTFDYYEDAQATSHLQDLSSPSVDITDVGGGGQYDPTNPASFDSADRLVRRNIRAVKVTLVGMNSAIDKQFNDASDTAAPNYRKMALTTTVVPRNLGIVSTPQSPLQPPPAPTAVSVCVGYCGVAYVTWSPGDPSTYSTGSTGAESFAVAYDDVAPPAGTFSDYFPSGTLTNYAVDMTQLGTDIETKTYYFKVAATNAAGSSWSTAVGPVSIKNATKPNAPTAVTATGSGGAATPKVVVSWKAPTGFASGAITCTTGTTTTTSVADETQGYRIYRGTSSGFPASGNLLIDVGAPGPVADGAGGWSYADTTVSACTPYYYKVQAVEWCTTNAKNTSGSAADAESALSSEVTATVTASKASTPAGVLIDPSSACTFTPNKCDPIIVKFNKVTTDVAGGAVNIDKYDIYRRVRHGTYTSLYSKVDTMTGMASATSPISWTQPSPPLSDHESAAPFEQDYYDYYVVAQLACGDSDPSLVVSIPNTCDTGVTVSTTNGTGAGTVGSPYIPPTNSNLVVKLNAGAAPYTAITAAQVMVDSGAPVVLTSASTPPWSTTWPDPGDGSDHNMTFIVTTTCNQTLPTVYVRGTAPGCHLQTTAVDPTMIVLGTPPTGSDYEIDVTFKNLSSDTVTLKTITITDSVPKKGHWNSVKLPGGTSITTATPLNLPADGGNSGAVTFTKTFDVTSAVSTDKTIPGGTSKVYKLLYTVDSGGNAVAAANITALSVTMSTAAGGATPFTCTIK